MKVSKLIAILPHLLLIRCEAAFQHHHITTNKTAGTPRSIILPFSGRRQGNINLAAFNIDEIESNAISAAEIWDISVTKFLSPGDATTVESRLGNRADVSLTRIPSTAIERCKFLFTNPELEVDVTEYYASLRVDNIALGSVDPWGNVLTSIGVDLDDVGDVRVVDDAVVYLAVDPDVAKICCRLLPKELPGAGVTVSVLGEDDVVPDGGSIQSLDVQRLDKREQKRK
eukprot:CAMPEP_0196819268 /NCGR_PEP_ID=MMETSP1362-20130617/69797_1 /TAXON_ID=163516 /ORGANISM="Leptocylindrus danicus, Strain CCMP1856" /LENGTH=227 /DNA_ID=CAMNT_0042197687 /DNA_START=53 /DNA_END=736 /DNA_ORIENTATION=-